MKKKNNEKVLIGIFAFIAFILKIYSVVKKQEIYGLISDFIILIESLYLAYSMLIKNNIYLLAGMSKEDAEDPKLKRKYRKFSILLGIICIYISLNIFLDLFFYIKKMYKF